MRYILLAALLLTSNAFAHGSSHPSQAPIASPQPPCFIQVSSVTYANIFTISSIEKYGDDRVKIVHGNNSSLVVVGETNQDVYIARMISKIQRACK